MISEVEIGDTEKRIMGVARQWIRLEKIMFLEIVWVEVSSLTGSCNSFLILHILIMSSC